MACVSHWQEQSHKFLYQPQQPYTQRDSAHQVSPTAMLLDFVTVPRKTWVSLALLRLGVFGDRFTKKQTGLARAEQSGPRRRFSRRKLGSDHRKCREGGQVTQRTLRPCLHSLPWRRTWCLTPKSMSTACFLEWTRILRKWRAHVHKYILRGSIIHRLAQHWFLPKCFKTTNLFITTVTLWDGRPCSVQSPHTLDWKAEPPPPQDITSL